VIERKTKYLERQGVLATCLQERAKFYIPTWSLCFTFPSGLFLAIIVLDSTKEFVAYR
jgi:hypothetical protein